MTHSIQGLKAEGWRELRSPGFTNAIGQVLFRTDRGPLYGGFLAADGMDNGNGNIVHGGAMMTFADIVLGFAAAKATRTPFCATVQMSYQFVGSARIGDFVTCESQIVRQTRTLVFARGVMRVDDRDIGTVDALFKPMDGR